MYNDDNLEYYITCDKGSNRVGYVNFENNNYKVVQTPEEATVIKSKDSAKTVLNYINYIIPTNERDYCHALLNVAKSRSCIKYLILITDYMSRYHKYMFLRVNDEDCDTSISVRTTMDGSKYFDTFDEAKIALNALRTFWKLPTLSIVTADINLDDNQDVDYHYVDIGSGKVTTNIPNEFTNKYLQTSKNSDVIDEDDCDF